jgi:hypothetical protein
MVDYDEGFVKGANKKLIISQLKCGKRSQSPVLVGIELESILLDYPETGIGSLVNGYYKIRVLAEADSENVHQFIKRISKVDVVLFTDRNTAYVILNKIVNTYFTLTSRKEETKHTLRWVHKTISNLNRNLLGIYHMVTYKYLQNYLNEIVYKLNRRYFCEKLLKLLIIASVHPYVH